MKKILLITILFANIGVFGQFSTVSKTIIDNQKNNQKYKTGLDSVDCNTDTLQYGRYKARFLRPITASLGFSLGQLYSAPGMVTVKGFTFYAWFIPQKDKTYDVFCHIYEAGTDSLPKGKPLQTKKISIDTLFGGGQLTNLERHAIFDTAVKTNKPYILVVEVVDSGRLATVSNDWTSREGRAENLMCGTVAGTWYRGLNLNIAGARLDCDMLLEPHVSYSINANFTFDNCYNYRDTVKFTNTSSGFIFDPMYNRWAFSNNTNVSNTWNYGHNFSNFSSVNGIVKYANSGNYDVRLINRLLHFKNGTSCIDTTIKSIEYMPSFTSYSGRNIDSLCSGDSVEFTPIYSGNLWWFNDSLGKDTLGNFKTYKTSALNKNDTIYLQLSNGSCATPISNRVFKVNTTPKIIEVANDSICLNSASNLLAKTDFGIVKWYPSPVSRQAFHEGEIYSTTPLNSDVTYYVEADNNGCISANRAEVSAFVSADFAPQSPQVLKDTTVCLSDGNILVYANDLDGNQLLWYNVPSGGNPISSADNYSIAINSVGKKVVYVESFDGRCASSRVPVNVSVETFPKSGLQNFSFNICQGEDFMLDLKLNNGSAKWYETSSSTTAIFDSNYLLINNISQDYNAYFQPYFGACSDTMRYAIRVNAIENGKLKHVNKQDNICQGGSIVLNAEAESGIVSWYSDALLTTEIGSGKELLLSTLSKDTTVFFLAKSQGCNSPAFAYEVFVNKKANAGFNFTILSAGNFRFNVDQLGQGTYKWDLGDGTLTTGSQVVHKYISNGDFTVRLEVTPANGCKDTTERVMKVTGLVGVYALNNSEYKVYPNPVHDALQVQGSAAIHEVIVLDILGGKVSELSNPTKSSQMTIKTDHLQSGTYIIVITTDNGNWVERIVK